MMSMLIDVRDKVSLKRYLLELPVVDYTEWFRKELDRIFSRIIDQHSCTISALEMAAVYWLRTLCHRCTF